MRTKIVYVLVSQESDYYYEMLLLSHYSLRLYHPKGDAEVVLVMDTDTHQRLVNKKAPILDDVTPVVVDIPEEYTIMQRSRYLKTSLRSHVKGDFIFIDTDTIICDRLDEIDKMNTDVATVADMNMNLYFVDEKRIKFGRQAGFSELKNQPYYNSGVIYSKATEESKTFYEKWQSCWKKSIRNNILQDQPALCQANMEMGHFVNEISGYWNCQLCYPESRQYYSKAKIFHYLSNRKALLRNLFFTHLKGIGNIDDIAKKIVQNPKTFGYAVFTMHDSRTLNYIFSDLLSVYDNSPLQFKMYIFLSQHLSRPIKTLALLKQTLSRIFKSQKA